MLQLFPASTEALDPQAVYDDLTFPPELPADRPYVALNMITTVDGKSTRNGRAFGLGSQTDRLAMRKLRAVVDAVAVGAGTLRREAVDPSVPSELSERRVARGLSPQPLAILLSGSLDVPLRPRYFRSAAGVEVLIFTSARAVPERIERLAPHARIVVAGELEPDVGRVLTLLHSDFGVRRLLVEGGPSLNASFVAAGLVDELFWTVTPKILGGPALSLVEGIAALPGGPVRLDLVSAFVHESELLLRYRFGRHG